MRVLGPLRVRSRPVFTYTDGLSVCVTYGSHSPTDTDRQRQTQTRAGMSRSLISVSVCTLFECAQSVHVSHSSECAPPALVVRAGVTNQLCCQRAGGPHAACTGRCC